MRDTRFVKKSFRLTKAEYELLVQKMREGQEKDYYDVKDGFSGFLRETLLERNGAHTSMLRRQLADLRYEIRKIGVNVNQIAKRVNSNIAEPGDIAELLGDMERIENMFDEYKKKVETAWQSQN